MSTSYLWSLGAIASNTVFTYVINAFWLLVILLNILNRWYIGWWSLWAHGISHDIVVVWSLRLIIFTNNIILVCKGVWLLRYFERLCDIVSNLFVVCILSVGHVAFLFTRSLTLIMFLLFFNHKLILSNLFLLLKLHLHLILILELAWIVETF